MSWIRFEMCRVTLVLSRKHAGCLCVQDKEKVECVVVCPHAVEA